ncbi:hypothetical protein ACM66B_002384 [Microbotryomycetes sp. NB124-2]
MFDVDERRPIDSDGPLCQFLRDNPAIVDDLLRVATDPMHVDLDLLEAFAPIVKTPEGTKYKEPHVRIYMRVLRGEVAQHKLWATKFVDGFPTALVRDKAWLGQLELMNDKDVVVRIYGGLEFVQLRLRGKEWETATLSAHHSRAHPLASSLEELVIACHGAGRLNSAPGGLVHSWRPPLEVVDALRLAVTALDNFGVSKYPVSARRQSRLSIGSSVKEIDALRQSDTRRVKTHFEDAIAIWQHDEVDGGAFSDALCEETVKIAASLVYAPDGYHSAIRSLHEITKSDFTTRGPWPFNSPKNVDPVEPTSKFEYFRRACVPSILSKLADSGSFNFCDLWPLRWRLGVMQVKV